MQKSTNMLIGISFSIVLIDAISTYIAITYFQAKEMNPLYHYLLLHYGDLGWVICFLLPLSTFLLMALANEIYLFFVKKIKNKRILKLPWPAIVGLVIALLILFRITFEYDNMKLFYRFVRELLMKGRG